MKKNKIILVSIAVLLVFSVNLVYGEQHSRIQGKKYENRTNGIYDLNITDQQIEDYLNKLKVEVQRNNVNEIAKLISYPCRLNSKIVKKTINNEQEFKKLYSYIFTASLKSLILNTTIDDLFVNYQGFMIGNGEVWFVPDLGIFAFNIEEE